MFSEATKICQNIQVALMFTIISKQLEDLAAFLENLEKKAYFLCNMFYVMNFKSKDDF
jgi:hypothetical protein